MAATCPRCGGVDSTEWSPGYFECKSITGEGAQSVTHVMSSVSGIMLVEGTLPHKIVCSNTWFEPTDACPTQASCFENNHAPALALCVRCGTGVCVNHSIGIPDDFRGFSREGLAEVTGSSEPRRVCPSCVAPLQRQFMAAIEAAKERDRKGFESLPELRPEHLHGLVAGSIHLATRHNGYFGDVRAGSTPTSELIPAFAAIGRWPAPAKHKIRFADGNAKFHGWAIRERVVPNPPIHSERHHLHLFGVNGEYVYYCDSIPHPGTGGPSYFGTMATGVQMPGSRDEFSADHTLDASPADMLIKICQHRLQQR